MAGVWQEVTEGGRGGEWYKRGDAGGQVRDRAGSSHYGSVSCNSDKAHLFLYF